MKSRNKYRLLPPEWMDSILHWYCADYYLEEVQGDLHEWYAQKKEQSTHFLNARYFLLVIRYFSLERSRSFQKLIKNSNYLSMKSIFKLTYRNFRKDKTSGSIRLINLVFGITIFLLALLYSRYELSYDQYHKHGKSIYRLGQDHGGDRAWAAGPLGLGSFMEANIPEVIRMNRFIPVRNAWLSVGDKKFYEEGGYYADSAALTMFSYRMIQGNPSTALNDPLAIVISESMAKKYFGDENPMGQVIETEAWGGNNRTVTGVIRDVPDQSHFKFDFLFSIYAYGDADYLSQWRNYFVYTYIQTRPGADLTNIKKQVKDEFMSRYGGTAEDATAFKTVLTPLQKIHLFTNQEKDNADHGNVYHIYILFSIGVFILIISSINFINVTIIKGLDRAKEVGLRKTVGASKKQLVVQFLSENLILLLLSGLISLVLLIIIEPFFQSFSSLNIQLNFLKSPQILIPLLIIILILELISGLYPALQLTRFRPAEIIKPAGMNSIRLRKIGITRKALIITQFSLSIILVIGSLIVYNQMSYLKSRDLGFEKDQILLIPIKNSLRDKLETLEERTKNIPGVSNVCISGSVPGYRISMEGVRSIDDPEGDMSRILATNETFLDVYDIELVAGTNFSIATPNQREFIINETMAHLTFGDKDPIGQQLVWADTGRVVGVVKDFNFQSLHSEVEPLTIIRNLDVTWGYLSMRFNPQAVDNVLDGINAISNELYPNLPSLETEFLDNRFSQLYTAENRLQTIVWVFCAITIFLTISGIFGVASYNAHKRSKEIAIRKVLGASHPEMIWQLLKGFAYLLIAALAIGIPGALMLSKWWLQDFAYQVTVGPLVFVMSGLAMLLIVFLSSGIVSMKATMVNPASMLKDE